MQSPGAGELLACRRNGKEDTVWLKQNDVGAGQKGKRFEN